MNNKFEYHYQVRLNLEPLRAACLRYAKTFSKVEHQFQNKVFFQFDSDGVLLKASDKNSLNLAQKQFMQLSKVNQIDILTYNVDEEEYKQVIQREIKNSNKYSKCFMQLITYEAFKGISQQLKNFGYDEPMRLYEKYMKSHPKFSFLLCNEQQFQSVRTDLLKLFKSKNASANSTTSAQNSSNQIPSTQNLPTLQSSQSTQNYGTYNSNTYAQSKIQNGSSTAGQNNSLQKAKSENTHSTANKGLVQSQNKNSAAHQYQPSSGGSNRQLDNKQQKNVKAGNNIQEQQYTKVQYVKKEQSNNNRDLPYQNNQKINSKSSMHYNKHNNNNNNNNNNFDSNDSQNNDSFSSCQEEEDEHSNSSTRQYSNNRHKNQQYNNNNNKNADIYIKANSKYSGNSSTLYNNSHNNKSYFVKKEVQSYSKTGTDTTTTGSHHELEGNIRKQQQYYYNDDQDEYYENNYEDQNDYNNKINDSSDEIEGNGEDDGTGSYFKQQILDKVYSGNRGNHHKKNQCSSYSSGVPSRTPSPTRSSHESEMSIASEDSYYSYKEYIYPKEEENLQKFQLMTEQEKSSNFYSLFDEQSKLQQEREQNDNKNIDYTNNVSTASSSSSSSSNSSKQQQLSASATQISSQQQQSTSPVSSLVVLVPTNLIQQELIQTHLSSSNNTKNAIVDTNNCADIDGSISKLPELQELLQKGFQLTLMDPVIYLWLFASGKIKAEKEKKIKVIHDSKKVVVLEGLDSDTIKLASSLAFENLQRVTTNQVDALKQHERYQELKKKFDNMCCKEENTNIVTEQGISKQSSIEEESECSNNNNVNINKVKSKSKNFISQHQILELMSFEQFKDQTKKFKVRSIQKMCNDSFRQINPKDKQKGCIFFVSLGSNQYQKQNALRNEEIIKDISCKIESIFCQNAKLQKSKLIVDQTKPYYQYRQFEIKEVRKVDSINDSETAFIAEYRFQTYCLKQYLKLNDKKLNKIIANYLEQSIADNPQLNQIFGISVVSKGSDQKDKELYVLSELKYMNLKNILDFKVLKTESSQINVCIQIVNAVRNLHSKSIDDFKLFHGNLKPNNILFDESFNVYLSDINLDPIGCSNVSTSRGSSSQSLVNNNSGMNDTIIGSGSQNSSSNLLTSMNSSFSNCSQTQNSATGNQNLYCAPELSKNDQKSSKPSVYSDIWSLGLLLYEILLGAPQKIENKKKIKKLPYENFSKNFLSMKNIIQRCLSKEPQSRPQCEEILAELKEIQKQLNTLQSEK